MGLKNWFSYSTPICSQRRRTACMGPRKGNEPKTILSTFYSDIMVVNPFWVIISVFSYLIKGKVE